MTIFAAPPSVPPELNDCGFYHAMDLPGIGLQRGSWDLRAGYDAYFGNHDFTGERVLDLGSANGALVFEIERRGAREVVGFDLPDGAIYDTRLPTDEATIAEFREWIKRVKRGFWLAHALLQSRARVAYGHVGSLPDELGQFDTIMMGNILQHLRDPIGAVLQAVQRTRCIIITEADWLPGVGDDLPCMLMYDIPFPFSWYQVKPRLLQLLLEKWGFADQTLTWHTQTMINAPMFDDDTRIRWEECAVPTTHYTLSARRA